MSKAILVFNMPDRCWDCPIHASYAESAFSSREFWCTVKGEDVNPKTKPDWCPLKEAPEEYKDNWMAWERGYNTCLHEIIGN